MVEEKEERDIQMGDISSGVIFTYASPPMSQGQVPESAFGVKIEKLERSASVLQNSDSNAWSF